MENTNASPQTAELLQQLFKTASFMRFSERNSGAMQPPAFHDYLCLLCEKKGMVRERVIKRSLIERTYGHQIFRGIRTPNRDKVIQLAFGMSLSVEEAQRLLWAAGKSALYPRLKRDAAILFCLNRKEGMAEIELLLKRLGLTPLGDE